MRESLEKHGGLLLVALTAVLVYINSLTNGFALDDVYIIETNERVHQLAAQGRIWLTPYWPMYGAELGLYRPFAIFVYALQWTLGDGAAWVFHAVSVVLHAVAAMLAFLLLKKLTSEGPALVGGLLFAVHPVHTEAVANIVGQAELIAGVATFAACLIYVTRPRGARLGWMNQLALVVLYAVAILTKESAIVLPGLLIALDLAQQRVRWSRAGLRQYAADSSMLMFLFLATGIGYLAIRVDVLGSIGGVDAAPALPFLREAPRVPTALRAWPEYVRLLFYPADLAIDYAPGVILPVDGFSPMALLGLVILFLTFVLAVLTPLSPAAGLPAAWFLICILPVSNLLLPVGVVVAERLLYTPSFAAALIAAHCWRAGLAAARSSTHRVALLGLAASLLLLMSARTWVRNPDWKDTPTTLISMVRDHPESYRSQWTTAALLASLGNVDLGTEYLEIAYRLWPHNPMLVSELAMVRLSRGEIEAATALLERARDALGWASVHRYQLAVAYISAARFAEGLRETVEADRLGHGQSVLYPLYAQAYEGLRRSDLAIGAWRAALRAPSGDLWTYRARLARLLAMNGYREAALAQADSTASRIAPGDTASLTLIQRLRDSISRDCYTIPLTENAASPARCEDPLAHWRILTPHGPLHFATVSQNTSSEVAASHSGQPAGSP